MKVPVDYIPRLLSPMAATAAFEVLDRELPWGRHDLPRDEVYFNDHQVPYTYGSPGRERTYMPEAEWHPVVANIRAVLEDRLGFAVLQHSGVYTGPLDVCFINRYVGPRDSLGWHADDSPEMDPARPIVTVSLGAERDIQFQPIAMPYYKTPPIVREKLYPSPLVVEALTLGHGSGAIMAPGMQQRWMHRIPKSSQSHIGTRISLTFRGYLPEEARS